MNIDGLEERVLVIHNDGCLGWNGYSKINISLQN